MSHAITFLIGIVIGRYGPALMRRARHIHRKLRDGICFRYLPGPRENRNGTISNFCIRYGHPGGYHRFKE